MKKYTIKDSQGSKKTIYAENITHALTFVDSKIEDVDISFDKRIKNAVERGKLHNPPFDGLYAIKASKAEFPELKQELEKRKYKNIMFSNNPYNRYNVFFRDEVSLTEIDEAIDNIADKYGGFYSRTYDKVFKDLKAKYPNLKYEDVRRAIINYAENSSSANAQLRVAKKYFSDSVNESRVKDEASSVTTINALVNDEKAAIDSYNVAIKNLEGKIDEKAMQVLINIRNDERRHIENLYSILNGQVTEKNLEDSRIKDSKYYVGISTHGYTKEQAERDARKFGLQLKIVGKSRDPHFEYDAYFIGPRSNILKMLKANDLEEFEEDIEDSIHDALDVEGYANYGLRIKEQLPYDLFYDGHRKGLDFNAVLKNYDSIAKQILAKIKEYLYDAKKTLISFNKY